MRYVAPVGYYDRTMKEKPMAYRIERKVTIALTGTTISVVDLQNALKEFSPGAMVHIDYHKGYDQRDHDYVHLIVTPPPPKYNSESSPIYPPGAR